VATSGLYGIGLYSILHRKTVLSQGEPHDAAVNFDMYQILQQIRNKKLSYCCDSRSYCMQYFNAIHCDRNISTSE